MRRRPLLLDLFCCGGGAAKGYHDAGFDVVGVDCDPQPRYPFMFVQADALEYLALHGLEYDAIHASPPCQRYSATARLKFTKAARGLALDLVPPVREALVATGKPYVIENVVGAPLLNPIMLCGLMFGLKVFRHRLFESNVFLLEPHHEPHRNRRIGVDGFCCVAGHGDSGRAHRRVPYSRRSVAAWKVAMGIDWLNRDELAQAIPPAYTAYVGRQLISFLEVCNA